MVDRLVRFCIDQKLVVVLIVLGVVAWGVIVAPFDWRLGALPRRPVPVDAIPDIGENQQIVYSAWPGRSPKDVDDQVTYPLTVALLGIPDVKTVRSQSMFGFSMIYVIFAEGVPFEDSQNRIIARLNGLPAGTLPTGVSPALGPYATALGQVFWYTLEGRDPDGRPAGAWDLRELRSVQDWTVRYHLQAAEGVAEVASVGGFVQEYQVDVDPDAMRAHGVTLDEVIQAVQRSNLDVGARQIEINRVEYLIRARGFIQRVEDLENTVVKATANVPILIRHVARVVLGPAMREGALDKEGSEAVGGVVVVRHGYNPLAAIHNVKARIAEIAPALPIKAVVDYERTTRADLEAFASRHGFAAYDAGSLNQTGWTDWLSRHPRPDWPAGVSTSQIAVVPFYDRTGLIQETLGTLNAALLQQVLITTIVVIIMATHLRSAVLISAVMPLSVLISFIAMKWFRVDANLVSLSGIAIAIGTIVDMGIVMTDNIRQHLATAPPGEPASETVYRAASEVGGAIFTAIATTVVGFLPVFLMTGPEGRLFRPLAFTKTFCLIASVIVALTIIPAAAEVLFVGRLRTPGRRRALSLLAVLAGLAIAILSPWRLVGAVLAAAGLYGLTQDRLPAWARRGALLAGNLAVVLIVGLVLTQQWLPLGPEKGLARNLAMVAGLIGSFQLLYYLLERFYEPMMRVFLAHKLLFLAAPLAVTLLGTTAWLGFDRLFGVVPAAAARLGVAPEAIRHSRLWVEGSHRLPGLGKEFMPPLDEGSFLFMPTTMPHASVGEALDVIHKQDMALRAIPEVDAVVGKIGRAETALDPAPMNMIETVITYKPEFLTDRDGRLRTFAYDTDRQEFLRRDGDLIPDPAGRPYRQWRPEIRTPDDIWREIVRVTRLPGITSAPKLQPIAARIVMLQSGMRAPFGVKVKGPDLESVERAGMAIERVLKEVPLVDPATVIADRIVGKPYLEIDLDRDAAARYGLQIEAIQRAIQTALGGETLTTTVEGRERYPVRVRYLRELRDHPETLERILVPAMDGQQIPLTQLASVRYVRGPEAIKREDTFLIGYVLFDAIPGAAEVDVVESCQEVLQDRIDRAELALPPGVTYRFAGNYENQIHAQQTLALILPLTFFAIFMLIYFQFRSVVVTSLVFTTVFVCWGAGMAMIWLYGQPWFLDVSVLGTNLRDLFQVRPINLSIAIWVGFLALFGIASDDAVLVCTYLEQRFAAVKPA
ncbi:MAG: efflux RND transporter permease subunit, partial [Lentisphaerae bacterium]|nr:efflux RND transporter permease subunit [Lentisphaerota bacterium]